MAVEQLLLLDDLEHRRARAVVLVAQRAEHALAERRVVDELEVALGDLHARLRERHLEVLDERAEEGPLGVEPAQLLDRRRREPGTRAEPRGHDAPRLRPGEHPRDRAQRLELAAPGRASGRDTGREPISSRPSSSSGVNDRRKRGSSGSSQTIERYAACAARETASIVSRAPGGASASRLGSAVRSVAATAASRLRRARPGQAVLERDRLALLGELQPAGDSVRRLGEDRGMGRPAAAARAPAAAVEHRQLDPALTREPRELLLRLEDLPLRRDDTAVLAGVRVADHHLEAARAGCDRAAPRRARGHPAGRRSSRAAARRRPRDPPPPRAPPPRARRRPSGSSRRSACRSLADRGAAAGPRPPPSTSRIGGGVVAQRRASGSGRRGTDRSARRRRASARARRALRSAIRSPAWASRLSSTRPSSPRSSSAESIASAPRRSQIEVSRRRYGSVGLADSGRSTSATDRIRVDEGRRHPPRGGKLADVAPEELAHESRRQRSTASRTVAAPAFGFPSRSPPIHVPKRSGEPGSRACHAAEELGGCVPQALLEEPEALADLVDDPRPRRPDLVGLPEDRHLLRERPLARSTLRRGQTDVVELVEQPCDAPVLLEDRARERLGRMRGEHELDPDARRRRRQLLETDTLGLELAERLVERLAKRAALAARPRAVAGRDGAARRCSRGGNRA